MNMYEELLISLRRATEETISMFRSYDQRGLNHSMMMLLFMIEIKREIKTSEVAEHFGVTSGAATGIADKLEKMGLIGRERSKSDRRVVTLALTEDGKEFVKEKKKQHIELLQNVLADLDEKEITQTIQLLNKMSSLVEKHQRDKQS